MVDVNIGCSLIITMSRPLHNIKQTINSCKRKPDLSSFALSKILLVWLMMFNVSSLSTIFQLYRRGQFY